MRRKRKWDELVEEDPAAGLLNLFDVWIAFAAALLLAMVGYLKSAPIQSRQSGAPVDSASVGVATKNGVKLEHYRPTNEKMSGEGQRLGTAYKLKSGEVVYVPENGL